MGTHRKLAASIVAASLPIGLLVSWSTTGTAWAKAATGTVSCSSLGATVTFKPPLLPGGTAVEKATIKPITMGDCTPTAGGSASVAKVTATLKVKGTNSCAAFAQNVGSDSLTLVIKWVGASTSKVVFKAGSLSVNNTQSGFVATGGKASGSYKLTGASFTANMSTASQSQLVSCMSGSATVSSLQIVSGSATL